MDANEILDIILTLATKVPGAVAAITDLLKKRGYTPEEIADLWTRINVPIEQWEDATNG